MGVGCRGSRLHSYKSRPLADFQAKLEETAVPLCLRVLESSMRRIQSAAFPVSPYRVFASDQVWLCNVWLCITLSSL